MKKVLVLTGIVLLALGVAISTSACKSCGQQGGPQGGETVKPQPPVTVQPEGTPTPTKVISPDVYWKIQLERQQATKQLYAEMLAVYQKYNGNTPEAQTEIAALQQKHNARMQEILTANGLTSGQEIFPQGPERQQILQERNQYIQSHPEIKDQFTALAKEIKGLKDQIDALIGKPVPPTAPAAPAAPAAPPPTTPEGSTAPAAPAAPTAPPPPATPEGSTAPAAPAPPTTPEGSTAPPAEPPK